MELPAFFLLGAVGGASVVYLFMRMRLKQQEQELLTAQALLSNEQDKSLAIEKIEKQLRDTFGAAAADAPPTAPRRKNAGSSISGCVSDCDCSGNHTKSQA